MITYNYIIKIYLNFYYNNDEYHIFARNLVELKAQLNFTFIDRPSFTFLPSVYCTRGDSLSYSKHSCSRCCYSSIASCGDDSPPLIEIFWNGSLLFGFLRIDCSRSRCRCGMNPASRVAHTGWPPEMEGTCRWRIGGWGTPFGSVHELQDPASAMNSCVPQCQRADGPRHWPPRPTSRIHA